MTLSPEDVHPEEPERVREILAWKEHGFGEHTVYVARVDGVKPEEARERVTATLAVALASPDVIRLEDAIRRSSDDAERERLLSEKHSLLMETARRARKRAAGHRVAVIRDASGAEVVRLIQPDHWPEDRLRESLAKLAFDP